MRVARPTLITRESPLYQGALFDDNYLIEFKLDGDRVIYQQDEDGCQIFNRYMKPYEQGSFKLDIPPSTILDGEYWRGEYYVFDIVKQGGMDVYQLPLWYRKDMIKLLNVNEMPKVYEKDDPLAEAEHYGFEGLVIKNLHDPYPFKKDTWLKVRL